MPAVDVPPVSAEPEPEPVPPVACAEEVPVREELDEVLVAFLATLATVRYEKHRNKHGAPTRNCATRM
jgi:hypothetical protein